MAKQAVPVEAAPPSTHRLDELGRVVIPVRIRRALGWGANTWVTVTLDGSNVVISTWDPVCWICGTPHAQLTHRSHPVCAACYDVLVRGHRILP